MMARLVLLVTLERPPFEGAIAFENGEGYYVRLTESEAEVWVREHDGVMFVDKGDEIEVKTIWRG